MYEGSKAQMKDISIGDSLTYRCPIDNPYTVLTSHIRRVRSIGQNIWLEMH